MLKLKLIMLSSLLVMSSAWASGNPVQANVQSAIARAKALVTETQNLRDAVIASDVKGIKRAIVAGADANTYPYGHPYNPFTYAVESGNEDLISFLLEHGAKSPYNPS